MAEERKLGANGSIDPAEEATDPDVDVGVSLLDAEADRELKNVFAEFFASNWQYASDELARPGQERSVPGLSDGAYAEYTGFLPGDRVAFFSQFASGLEQGKGFSLRQKPVQDLFIQIFFRQHFDRAERGYFIALLMRALYGPSDIGTDRPVVAVRRPRPRSSASAGPEPSASFAGEPPFFVPLSSDALAAALRRVSEEEDLEPTDPNISGPTDSGFKSGKDVVPLLAAAGFGGQLLATGVGALTEVGQQYFPASIDGKTGPEAGLRGSIKPPPGYTYGPTGLILSSTFFGGAKTTGEIQNRFDLFFRKVNMAPPDEFFYYDALGNELGHFTLPQDLKDLRAKDSAAYKVARQEWHNKNRREIMPVGCYCPTEENDPGYPLVASSVVPDNSQDVESGKVDSFLNRALNNLTETVKSGDTHPVYFGGEELTLYEGIRKITEAYGVPLSLAIGLGAVENAFRHLGPDSDAGAKGIYQVMPNTFPEIRAFIATHSYAASLRTEPIGEDYSYQAACSNRFVSTELFCAYYHLLGQYVREAEDALEARIRQLDPHFPAGCLREIAIINAYNSGPGNINKAMLRFAALSDEELRARIGDAPYGTNVWIALMAHSFDATVNGGHSNLQTDGFTYPQKVSGLGSLICEDMNYFLQYDRPMEGFEDEDSALLGSMQTSANKALGVVGALAPSVAVLSGAVAATAGTVLAVQGVTRREVLRGGAGLLAMGAPLGVGALTHRDSIGAFFEDSPSTLPPDSREPEEQHPVYLAAQQRLSRLRDALRKRRDEDGISARSWLPIEATRRKYSKSDRQRALLHAPIEDMFGGPLVEEFAQQKSKPLRERLPTYEKAKPLQEAYIAEQKAKGNLLPFAPDDPNLPIFAEQVGMNTGISNNSEALYLHKDFFWILKMTLDLVNDQIREFNTDKAFYGVDPSRFPDLAQIEAFKTSGALRRISQTIEQFQMGKGSQTTPGITPHWTGLAVDIMSFGPSNSHLVRFAEDQKSGPSSDAKVLYKKGDKLPNNTGGDEITMRTLYQMMTERALFALLVPLREQFGIELAPLYEDNQLNIHITMLPAEYRGR